MQHRPSSCLLDGGVQRGALYLSMWAVEHLLLFPSAFAFKMILSEAYKNDIKSMEEVGRWSEFVC